MNTQPSPDITRTNWTIVVLMALGFGLVGIFVGPVMLAVSYTLIDAWLKDADPPEIEAKR